ncbi:MAG: hypothetical protein EBE86_000015 [Hormoscilla sp. GUM202]|nr:hypothetical protein [Hormoscilla sp. GUM202]
MIEQRTFLEMPRWSAIWRETQGTLSQFFTNAIPLFLLLPCLVTALTIAREQSVRFAVRLMARCSDRPDSPSP